MFIVKIQNEIVVYNTVKNKYEVSSIKKYQYSFKDKRQMFSEMNKRGYEYKDNIYKNKSGWVKITEVKSNCDNHPNYLYICTGLIYSKRES